MKPISTSRATRRNTCVTFAGLATALLLAAGCGGGGDRESAEIELGGLGVRLEIEPARIEIRDAQDRLLIDGLPGAGSDRPAHSALAWRRAEASYEMSMGSFRIEETAAGAWRPVAALGAVERGPDALRFDLLDASGAALGSGRIAAVAAGHLELHFEPADPALNRASLGYACPADEHFLGLGGQSFDVDHRGFSVPLWVQEDGITKAEDDSYDELWFLRGRRHSTHTPMPITLSSHGYALLLETDRRSIFHLCSEAPEVTRIEAWEGELRLHLFAGADPAAVIERLTGHLGRPELPPAFAFAPWLDAIYGSDNVRRVARKLRQHDVPSSVIWTEDWRGGSHDGDKYVLDEDWRVDREVYPDFEQLAADLHALGFKFLIYNNTFISEGVDVWDEATAAGHTIETDQGEVYTFTSHKFEQSTLLDLTDPAAWDWAQSVYRQGLELGADGYMADFAEWLPTDARLESGADAVAFHNRYPVAFQRLTRELFDALEAADGVERLFFVRSAYLGSQPLVSVVWAGDQQTDFSIGDGLPSVIPMGIGLGVCGFPYYGHDIAGYMDQLTTPSTEELWYRWVTLGALSPVMRTHHGLNAEQNWNWERDAASTAHFARWARLHLRLFPYLYGLAEQASRTGLPMMRPLALAHPDFEPGWTATDQYMLGDRLYVAPVIEAGATRRQLELPAGRWYPLLGGEPLLVAEGGGPVTVEAAVDEIPVFVPAGSLLVLLPEGIDSLVAGAPDSGVVDHRAAGHDRVLWLWPGGESGWTEVGGLDYRWSAPGWQGPPAAATWNGQPVAIEDGAVELTGNGSLRVDGQAELEVNGGTADRSLRVVFR